MEVALVLCDNNSLSTVIYANKGEKLQALFLQGKMQKLSECRLGTPCGVGALGGLLLGVLGGMRSMIQVKMTGHILSWHLSYFSFI